MAGGISLHGAGQREPVLFPEHEQVPESSVHLRVRTALYVILERALRGKAFVGSDQFLYWDPTDAGRCLAPDVMVRLGMSSAPLPSFKTWKHGAPQLAVEILSKTDARDRDWSAKLESYCRSGVLELVRFDPEATVTPLAVWDLANGDAFQRDLGQEESRRSVLDGYWTVRPDAELGCVLRVANDPGGEDLWPTPEELFERERAARAADLARIAELEQKLRSG